MPAEMTPPRQMHIGLSIKGGSAIESARRAEQVKLDFVLIEDVAAIGDDGLKLEPTLALSAVAAVTGYVGLIPTVCTAYHPPYAFARRMASLDHLSRGRAGWHLVTGDNPAEARNYGLEAPLDPDTRQARALEFVEVATGLWDSWDDDAFIRDKASGIYFLRDRVHFLEHRGEHFQVRGPLDTARPIQGCLPILVSGVSDLAARLADMVRIDPPDLATAQRDYAAVKQRLAEHGRAPDALKVMAAITASVDRMEEWFATGAADGFILPPSTDIERLVPELQRRGLFRRDYTGRTLRDHLGLPRIPSRYELAGVL